MLQASRPIRRLSLDLRGMFPLRESLLISLKVLEIFWLSPVPKIARNFCFKFLAKKITILYWFQTEFLTCLLSWLLRYMYSFCRIFTSFKIQRILIKKRRSLFHPNTYCIWPVPRTTSKLISGATLSWRTRFLPEKVYSIFESKRRFQRNSIWLLWPLNLKILLKQFRRDFFYKIKFQLLKNCFDSINKLLPQTLGVINPVVQQISVELSLEHWEAPNSQSASFWGEFVGQFVLLLKTILEQFTLVFYWNPAKSIWSYLI